MMITIYRPDGTKLLDLLPEDSSACTEGVMRTGEVVLTFKSSKPVLLPPLCYVEWQGVRYTLYHPEEVRREGEERLLYTATFYTPAEELQQKLIKDPSLEARTSFTFTGTPREHLLLITRTMGKGWSVGISLEGADKMIAYNNETCLSALNRLASEYRTEWVVEGRTLSLRKHEVNAEAPLQLAYGEGKGLLSGLTRLGHEEAQVAGRLYVTTSDRNIDPTSYGAKKLRLPRSYSEGGFRTDSSGLFVERIGGGDKEAVLDLSHIYPMRRGKVSEVLAVDEKKHFYDIKDASIPESLNYNDYRIKGEKAVIKFESGLLAGREFELQQSETGLTGYDHKERRFKLIPRDFDGTLMPSRDWLPSVGDEYAIFGISLPEEYLHEAEERLLKEATSYLRDHSGEVLLTGRLDPLYARKHWGEIGGKLVAGGVVQINDPELSPRGTLTRITSIRRPLSAPMAPEVTFSNAPIATSLVTKLATMEAQEVVNAKRHHDSILELGRTWRQVEETREMLEKAYSDLGDAIKASTLQAMQVVVGSREGQFRFVTSRTSNKEVTPYPIRWDESTAQLKVSATILQHLGLGEGSTTLSPNTDPNAYRYWDVPAYTSPALEDDKAYYIYVSAPKVGDAAKVSLSATPLEHTADSYNLLVGILNSKVDGHRSYTRLHGYTEILPGRISVDRIASADGETYFDLKTGRIRGNISITGKGDIADWMKGEEDARKEGDEEVKELIPADWELYPTSDFWLDTFVYNSAGELNTLTYTVRWERNGVDVTELMKHTGSRLFAFRRRNPFGVDDKGLSDEQWNTIHEGAVSVTVSHEDVNSSAYIYTTFDDEEVEKEYQRLKGE